MVMVVASLRLYEGLGCVRPLIYHYNLNGCVVGRPSEREEFFLGDK